MIKIILAIVAVAIVTILVLAARQPDQFQVQRSTTIKAPPEKIAAIVADFGTWPSWSPYEKLDPAMKRTVSTPAAGKGATYAWEGNSKVGQGKMEILEVAPKTGVKIKLDFLKPFESNNFADFRLQPQGEATVVTWAMTGQANFLSKVMCVFFDMDRMVGPAFEEGLASLKTVAEK